MDELGGRACFRVCSFSSVFASYKWLLALIASLVSAAPGDWYRKKWKERIPGYSDMAENQKSEFSGDSGGGAGGGGGGGSGSTPPQARPAPDKGVKKGRRQQQQVQPQPKPVQLPKKAPVGPTVTERVLSVAASSKQRRGISLAALKKALLAMGYDVSRNNSRVNRTVRLLVLRGSLVRTSGTGASGSFRFNRTAAPKREKKAGAARRKAVSKREKKAGAARRKAVSKREKKAGAARRKAVSRKPTTAPSKRSTLRRRSPERQTKPRRTAARPFKRRPRTVDRPHAKARSRLPPIGGRSRTTRVYRRQQSVKNRKAARGRIQRPVGRPRKIRTKGLVEGTILVC
ncbi:uncharacterized protein LOC144607328 [Rhinoraja longicauda]